MPCFPFILGHKVFPASSHSFMMTPNFNKYIDNSYPYELSLALFVGTDDCFIEKAEKLRACLEKSHRFVTFSTLYGSSATAVNLRSSLDNLVELTRCNLKKRFIIYLGCNIYKTDREEFLVLNNSSNDKLLSTRLNLTELRTFGYNTSIQHQLYIFDSKHKPSIIFRERGFTPLDQKMLNRKLASSIWLNGRFGHFESIISKMVKEKTILQINKAICSGIDDQYPSCGILFANEHDYSPSFWFFSNRLNGNYFPLQIENPDIVISYSTKTDNGRGEEHMWKLAHYLKDNGIHSFNGLQVESGDNWRQVWFEKLRYSKILIVMMSPSYINSGACMEEINATTKYPSLRIIPLLYEPVQETCSILSEINWLPAPGKGLFQDNFQENSAKLKELCAIRRNSRHSL